MSTVGEMITRARGLMSDRADSNYVREFLNEQVTNSNKFFQVRNRNLLNVADDGAPADVQVLVAGLVVVPVTITASTGLIELATAPTVGETVEVRYFFHLNTDPEYLDFLRSAAGFVGTVPTYGALPPVLAEDDQITDNVEGAAVQYTAAQAARSMASMSHWWYSANQGNKSFNKDTISRKFMDQAKAWEDEARALRLDAYDRFDKRHAPATRSTNLRGVRPWTPPR